MATTLGALRDDHVGARLDRGDGVPQRCHHVHHLRAALVGLREDRGEILVVARPRGREDGRLELEHGLDQSLVAEEEQVDTDRLRRQLASARDLGLHRLRLQPGRAHDAEPPGVRDRSRQLTARGAAAHPGRDDGVLDPDELRERRPDAAHAAQTRELLSRLRPRHQCTVRKPAPITATPATASSTKWLPVTTIVRITSGG